MASFYTEGMDDVEETFGNLATIPHDVLTKMLKAQEKVIIKAQQASAPKDTGDMSKSIASTKENLIPDGIEEYIYPQGTHHVSKKSRYRNSKGKRTVTNAEVGFINEFGAPGRNIKASQWMRTANEKSAAETTAAAQAVFDEWVETL